MLEKLAHVVEIIQVISLQKVEEEEQEIHLEVEEDQDLSFMMPH